MNKLKVVTVVGTRPEIIRLSRVMAELDNKFDHIIIHTGQNYDYELNKIFFDDLDIRKPDFFLNSAGNSAIQTIGNILISIDKTLDEIKPDALLVLGDTNSCMAIISAKRKKIPTFHMEAGNRCFDDRVPEEINRRIVDHTADINLPYSSIAREYLIKEGLPADRIIKTGSPMREVLNYYKKKIESSETLKELKLKQFKYFLVSLHREENIDSEKKFININDFLNSIADKYNMPIIFSTHPRTKKKIDDSGLTFNKLIRFIKPLGFSDYNNLQLNSKIVLSDSGTISEESSILKFPALNIRESHERPEAMEEASVIMTGLETKNIMNAIEMYSVNNENQKRDLKDVSDYLSDNVSEKVSKIILSYTGYINRVVWRKY